MSFPLDDGVNVGSYRFRIEIVKPHQFRGVHRRVLCSRRINVPAPRTCARDSCYCCSFVKASLLFADTGGSQSTMTGEPVALIGNVLAFLLGDPNPDIVQRHDAESLPRRLVASLPLFIRRDKLATIDRVRVCFCRTAVQCACNQTVSAIHMNNFHIDSNHLLGESGRSLTHSTRWFLRAGIPKVLVPHQAVSGSRFVMAWARFFARELCRGGAWDHLHFTRGDTPHSRPEGALGKNHGWTDKRALASTAAKLVIQFAYFSMLIERRLLIDRMQRRNIRIRDLHCRNPTAAIVFDQFFPHEMNFVCAHKLPAFPGMLDGWQAFCFQPITTHRLWNAWRIGQKNDLWAPFAQGRFQSSCPGSAWSSRAFTMIAMTGWWLQGTKKVFSFGQCIACCCGSVATPNARTS